ncbi:hypothetical protein [Ornithinimicrobium sp. W1665]|uniref:hypothetical protein n=1 Tax=Ornithinimicrobium sp. W1665 TaxID=3416666 RepID=UPI003CF043EA
MNTLRALREDLQAVLAPIGTVLDHLPERITPPVAIIAAGSPYVEAGETFGSWSVRFTVVLVASQGTNQTATRQLDHVVAATAVALDQGAWDVERIDQPTMLGHAGTHFLSTTVDVARTVDTITDGGT